MTHGHGEHGQAGPHHGPAHPGERSSAEPGGFDEFDHEPPADPVPGEATAPADPATDSATDPGFDPDADSGAEAINTEAVNDEAVNDERGTPVVSDGTAPEGDSAEPLTVEHIVGTGAYRDLAAERLEDLRRLQAEYVNYKRRVDRDRSLARDQGITHVLESMLPVLDEIHLAREHGDLGEGAPAAIVDKLEQVLAKLGIERFGAEGDPFDPLHHEALMRLEADLPEGAESTTVVKVLQPGYRLGERVVRAARVAVADPA